MKRLLVGTAGIALFACACGAQTMVEHSLITAGAASAAAGMKKAGDSVGSALGKVSQTLDKTGASARVGSTTVVVPKGAASAAERPDLVPKGAASAAEGPNLAAPDPAAPVDVRKEDSALLPISGAVLYNNVYGKGDIANYRQLVFRGQDDAGWEWDWPESAGPSMKSYPEVLLGRSPWSEARAGDQLPRRLAETRLTLDFDFTTVGSGRWCESFDFWITRSDRPSSKDIVSNLTVWTMKHGLEPSYRGRRTTLRIGGRTYEATFETPTERPDKPWKTLCLVDTEPRSRGSLELGPLVDALIAHGLAQPTDFLATAELGSEVAYGKGRTTLRVFRLR